MKRIALILIILSCCCCFVSAQERIGSGLNPNQLSFAALVESDAWKNAQTFQQRVALCQIPDEVLPTLSTAQLVELCVSNPLNGIINAYDNPMTTPNGWRSNLQNLASTKCIFATIGGMF